MAADLKLNPGDTLILPVRADLSLMQCKDVGDYIIACGMVPQGVKVVALPGLAEVVVVRNASSGPRATGSIIPHDLP